MLCPFSVSGESCMQVVRTDINFYYAENDYELDNDDLPKGFPQGHGAETLKIKSCYFFYQIRHENITPESIMLAENMPLR